MAPHSPYHSPYEVAQPPMSGYGQGIPGVSPMITEPDGTSRVQLAIVGAQVGAVLGRNGTNISQIRQVSGTYHDESYALPMLNPTNSCATLCCNSRSFTLVHMCP